MANKRGRPKGSKNKPKSVGRDLNLSTDGTFSGDGFVRDKGEGHGVRFTNPTHMSPADPTVAQEALSSTEASGVFPNRHHPQKARQVALASAGSLIRPGRPGRTTKLAVLGIPSKVLESGSQEYHRCVKLAQSYKKARQKEFFEAHGYVSSGVGALLAAASLALSASRYLYELACNTPTVPDERGGLSMPAVLKMASSLSDSARQNELSAWELCAREAVVRKRNATDNVQLPWMTAESPAGEVKRGPGRPRKVALAQENQFNARTVVPGTAESPSQESSVRTEYSPWEKGTEWDVTQSEVHSSAPGTSSSDDGGQGRLSDNDAGTTEAGSPGPGTSGDGGLGDSPDGWIADSGNSAE